MALVFIFAYAVKSGKFSSILIFVEKRYCIKWLYSNKFNFKNKIYILNKTQKCSDSEACIARRRGNLSAFIEYLQMCNISTFKSCSIAKVQ